MQPLAKRKSVIRNNSYTTVPNSTAVYSWPLNNADTGAPTRCQVENPLIACSQPSAYMAPLYFKLYILGFKTHIAVML